MTPFDVHQIYNALLTQWPWLIIVLVVMEWRIRKNVREILRDELDRRHYHGPGGPTTQGGPRNSSPGPGKGNGAGNQGAGLWA